MRCKRPRRTGCTSATAPLTAEIRTECPYSNSWVALAHQLQNDTLLGYTETFLNHVLASRHPSGDFGPGPFNASLPTLLWPRYLIMLGLIVSFCVVCFHGITATLLCAICSNTRRQTPLERTKFATSYTLLYRTQRSASRMAISVTRPSAGSMGSRSSAGKRYAAATQPLQV